MRRDDERPLSRHARERIDLVDGMREKYRQGARPSELLREYIRDGRQQLSTRLTQATQIELQVLATATIPCQLRFSVLTI